MSNPTSRVLLIVPFFNRDGLGEDFSNYKWIAGLAEKVDVTVLGIRRGGVEQPLGDTAARFIGFGEGAWHRTFVSASSNYRKLSRGLKPSYLSFYRRAKSWSQAPFSAPPGVQSERLRGPGCASARRPGRRVPAVVSVLQNDPHVEDRTDKPIEDLSQAR